MSYEINLIEGERGKLHVTSDDARTKNAAMFGVGRKVFNMDDAFEATLIGSNTVRIASGVFYNNGMFIRIDRDKYVEVNIENGLPGTLRNDLICIRYERNIQTQLESASIVVKKGVASETVAVDPDFAQGDVLDLEEHLDEFPLYRVSLNGLTPTLESMFIIEDEMDNFSIYESLLEHIQDDTQHGGPGTGEYNILDTFAQCLVSSVDTDIVGAKVMTEIDNALKGKMNYVELNSENIDSTFTNHIAMGVVDNNLYITMGCSWINFQFRVHSSGWLYRIAYGSSGWGDWHNGSIDIDNTLSTTSTNPLQNKVITTSLNNKADKTSVLSTLTECEASTKNTDIVGASALAELSDKIGTILYSAMVSSSKNIETSTSVLLGGVAFEKGAYVVDAYVRWSSTNTAGIRSIALLNHQNPTYELYAFPESDIMIPDGMPSTCGQHIQTIFSFEQTTTMYFYIKQNSGSTIPIDMAYVKAIKLK